jgi:hypothetical protein
VENFHFIITLEIKHKIITKNGDDAGYLTFPATIDIRN